jgi:hypothetical protein
MNDPTNDSLTALLLGLHDDARPPIDWVLRWSADGRDPVQAAWDACTVPPSMVTVIRHGFGVLVERDIRRVMQNAFSDVDHDAVEVPPPTGWPPSPPKPPSRARGRALTWSMPRGPHGPTRLRYVDLEGIKWYERVNPLDGGHAIALNRLKWQVAVHRIRRVCPVPPTLEQLLRAVMAVRTHVEP